MRRKSIAYLLNGAIHFTPNNPIIFKIPRRVNTSICCDPAGLSRNLKESLQLNLRFSEIGCILLKYFMPLLSRDCRSF